MVYRLYKCMRKFIEDNCNELTNHQQRTTSTINGIVLMETSIIGSCEGKIKEEE